MPRTATFPPNRISQVLNLNSGGERACNWFHSTGWDGHFCPNVFPLAAPQDLIKVLCLRRDLALSQSSQTNRSAARNAPHLPAAAQVQPPVIRHERIVLHTVRTLQVIPYVDSSRGMYALQFALGDTTTGRPRCRRVFACGKFLRFVTVEKSPKLALGVLWNSVRTLVFNQLQLKMSGHRPRVCSMRTGCCRRLIHIPKPHMRGA